MSRVALYARYSSDQQREASIEDQLRLCRLYAEKQGWTIVDSRQDRAVSGASLIRPGIQALLADALRGRFEVVLAEALDRISRDQEDVAGVFKRMAFAGWHFDLVARHLLSPQGTVVMLSGAEFRLLKVFLDHPNRVLNRDQLLNLTKGRDADPFDRSIDLQVSRLRQKLDDDAKAPALLKTVRNEGYVLAASVTTEN